MPLSPLPRDDTVRPTLHMICPFRLLFPKNSRLACRALQWACRQRLVTGVVRLARALPTQRMRRPDPKLKAQRPVHVREHYLVDSARHITSSVAQEGARARPVHAPPPRYPGGLFCGWYHLVW